MSGTALILIIIIGAIWIALAKAPEAPPEEEKWIKSPPKSPKSPDHDQD